MSNRIDTGDNLTEYIKNNLAAAVTVTPSDLLLNGNSIQKAFTTALPFDCISCRVTASA